MFPRSRCCGRRQAHEDLVVDRLELMHDPRNKPLAERVRDDVVQLSPGTEVRLVEMALANPWDFGEVYGALYDWMSAYAFDTEREEYWAHITTGTHVAQICMVPSSAGRSAG